MYGGQGRHRPEPVLSHEALVCKALRQLGFPVPSAQEVRARALRQAARGGGGVRGSTSSTSRLSSSSSPGGGGGGGGWSASPRSPSHYPGVSYPPLVPAAGGRFQVRPETDLRGKTSAAAEYFTSLETLNANVFDAQGSTPLTKIVAQSWTGATGRIDSVIRLLMWAGADPNVARRTD